MPHEQSPKAQTNKLARRRFLRDAATTATVVCFSPGLLSGCVAKPSRKGLASTNGDAMDQGLEMMAKLAPLTNHGPMAAEALVALGRSDNVDCGLASLKAMLEAWGVSVSYGRLRDGCQTHVDGPSISTMKEVDSQLHAGGIR